MAAANIMEQETARLMRRYFGNALRATGAGRPLPPSNPISADAAAAKASSGMATAAAQNLQRMAAANAAAAEAQLEAALPYFMMDSNRAAAVAHGR